MKSYLLNTSFHMDPSVAEEFEGWVKNSYIPTALKSPYLADAVFTRLLTEIDESAVGYAVHFRTTSLDDARKWHDSEAAQIKDEFFRTHNGKIVFFTTFMEEL